MAAGERGWIVPGFTPKRVLVVAALFVVAYFGLLIASNALIQQRVAQDEAALRREIGALQRREARLQALRDYMHTDAFIEAAARENGLVRPGETAVVILGADDTGAHLQPGDPWWYRYLHPDDRP
jgi:cell division protein FtsB